MERIKCLLDEKVTQYNCKDFIKNDPIQFPHTFSEKKDIEIAALLASIIAWGNRTMIIRSGEKMFFNIMQGKPYDFVMQGNWLQMDETKNIHRTFFVRDFVYICQGLKYIYERHNTMEDIFANVDTWEGIANLRNTIAEANNDTATKHISNPIAGKGKPASACKRLHMMLRWLCRNDGIVDLGIWESIHPSQLMIPLDVHVARISRSLGIVSRKQNDRRTVEELTAKLRMMCPDDPVKYDFALFGIGIESITSDII